MKTLITVLLTIFAGGSGVIICCIIMALAGGCTGHNCIGVTGEYQDYKGSLEWCFDIPASKAIGRAVIDETADTGNKRRLVAIDMADIDALADFLKTVPDRVKDAITAKVAGPEAVAEKLRYVISRIEERKAQKLRE